MYKYSMLIFGKQHYLNLCGTCTVFVSSRWSAVESSARRTLLIELESVSGHAEPVSASAEPLSASVEPLSASAEPVSGQCRSIAVLRIASAGQCRSSAVLRIASAGQCRASAVLRIASAGQCRASAGQCRGSPNHGDKQHRHLDTISLWNCLKPRYCNKVKEWENSQVWETIV